MTGKELYDLNVEILSYAILAGYSVHYSARFLYIESREKRMYYSLSKIDNEFRIDDISGFNEDYVFSTIEELRNKLVELL